MEKSIKLTFVNPQDILSKEARAKGWYLTWEEDVVILHTDAQQHFFTHHATDETIRTYANLMLSGRVML